MNFDRNNNNKKERERKGKWETNRYWKWLEKRPKKREIEKGKEKLKNNETKKNDFCSVSKC